MGWHRHTRFFVALAVGAALYGAGFALPPDIRALLGVNGFFAAYLGLMLALSLGLSSDTLRAHAEVEDEGAALILTLALLAVSFSLGAIFLALNDQSNAIAESLFALASVPLGWATLHVMAAFRYAHLYFVPDPDAGLEFPGTKTPDIWDFFYFSFTIGMTAQVSDVVVSAPRLRRMVLFHGVGSFFYNTVLLALAVNAALALSR
jgi:uncharacterized membrane protein